MSWFWSWSWDSWLWRTHLPIKLCCARVKILKILANILQQLLAVHSRLSKHMKLIYQSINSWSMIWIIHLELKIQTLFSLTEVSICSKYFKLEKIWFSRLHLNCNKQNVEKSKWAWKSKLLWGSKTNYPKQKKYHL